MNNARGFVELKNDQEVIGFQFGTNALKLFCELNGNIELWQVPETGIYGEVHKEGDEIIIDKAPNVFKRYELFFCAYQSACRIKGEPVKHNIDQIIHFIDNTEGAFDLLNVGALEGRIMGKTIGEPEGNR
jgi:hypothetical protein